MRFGVILSLAFLFRSIEFMSNVPTSSQAAVMSTKEAQASQPISSSYSNAQSEECHEDCSSSGYQSVERSGSRGSENSQILARSIAAQAASSATKEADVKSSQVDKSYCSSSGFQSDERSGAEAVAKGRRKRQQKPRK